MLALKPVRVFEIVEETVTLEHMDYLTIENSILAFMQKIRRERFTGKVQIVWSQGTPSRIIAENKKEK